MAWLYKRALDDAIGLTSLLIMVLLDDAVYKTQKKALIDYVNTLPPQSNADELGTAVHTALRQNGINGAWLSAHRATC